MAAHRAALLASLVVMVSLTLLGQSTASDVDDGVDESNVIVLTSENFSAAAEDTESIWLVEFYAPWCGHCKSLRPEYAKAATILKDKHPNVKLAKVDATEEGELASDYDVTGYPTMKILRDGKVYDYEGGRTADAIVGHMEKQASPDWTPPKEHVVELTEETFDDFVNSQPLMMVAFVAPWCGHCKSLKPDYKQAAKILADSNPPISLATVDATANIELAKRFDVSGYPTLKVFRKGKPSDYDGQRSAQDIVEHMVSLSYPAALAIETVAEATSMTDGDDPVVIAFFDDQTDARIDVLQEAAETFRKIYEVVYTVKPEVRAHYKGASVGDVVLFQPRRYQSKYEPASFKLAMNDETSAKDVEAFIESNAYPLVGYRSKEGVLKYDKQPIVVVYFNGDYSEDLRDDTNYWREKVASVAAKFGDKVNKDLWFAIASDAEYFEELQVLNRHNTDEDHTVAIYDKDGSRYLMEEEFDTDTLHSFVEDFLAGGLTRHVRSEPVPREDDGRVKIVVGSTFEQVVDDNTKDVLLEIYAPWCGHCKKLAPTYRKLAKKLKNVKDLVVAKIDATANDLPPTYSELARGFPTIVLAKRNAKDKPIKFEGGEREVDHFLDFLRKNASVKIPKFKKKEKVTKDEL